jgi:glucokinase
MNIGAVDIGGTKMAAGVVDERGQVLVWRSMPTDANSLVENAVEQIAGMLRDSLAEACPEGGALDGIGIGCTGPVYRALGTLGYVEFMPGWEGAHITAMLTEITGAEAFIENDADAAALGEWAWGKGRGTQNFMLVTVGTGIGVGLVLNGQLYRGVDGAHPEIGHHFVDPNGPLCFCGGHGCWEVMASGPAMERWAQANHPQGLYRTAQQLCDAAREGEPLAEGAVDRTARYLGIGFANLVTLYTPEMIAVGGGLVQAWELFWPTVERTVQTTCGLVPYERVMITPASMGAQTGLVGAAQVWISRSIEKLS